MENMENLVTEVTENVEHTTEQTPKTYTQEEVDAIVCKRIARTENKLRKEYDRKYGDLTDVLRTGTGKQSVEELTDAFKSFYENKGIRIAKKPEYSEHDNEVLAQAEAAEIIRGGFEDVVDEVDRLTQIGLDKMTDREKRVFKTLAEHRVKEEHKRSLSEIGVTEDVYASKEFTEFASKFNSNTPIRDIYDIYNKTQPKKEIKTMGSMKSNPGSDSGVKEFYTVEEARKFKKADYDKNPALYEAVQRSMQKWKK